ncbi:MAG TPA: HD domain-containing protein [Mycobacterium sp.]|nr:HD domain-containing protein [Mycobacterium sp.]
MIVRRNPYIELGKRYDTVKTFTLPVSGSVLLFGPEIDIVRTREFQRLAGIKQLGTSYVVYRGALHTRFEHSLGTLHQAERMLRAVQANPRDPYPVSDRALRFARLGALLHDLTHVPFGHTLEDELQLLRRHDLNQPRIRRLLINSEIGRILKRSMGGDDFLQLCAVLNAKTDSQFAELEFPFVGDVVGNTVCADLLDYVQRDLLACGLPSALGDRFLDYLSVTSQDEGLPVDHSRLVLNLNKRGMPRPDVESEVVKLLTYRYELAERVYFHHAKNAASVMIGRAVQEAGLAMGLPTPPRLDANFLWVSDELLLAGLAHPEVESAIGLMADPQSIGDRSLASRLAKGVQQRDLYKIAYLVTWDDIPDAVARLASVYQTPDERRELEDQLADLAGVRRGRVLVHIPAQRMMSKDADVRVRTGRGEIVKLHEWDGNHSQRLSALNEAHGRLWRVMVYVHPAEEGLAPIVRAAAEDRFQAPSQYVPGERTSRYQQAVFDSLSERWHLDVEDGDALSDAAYAPADTRRSVERAILAAVRRRRRDAGGPPLQKR